MADEQNNDQREQRRQKGKESQIRNDTTRELFEFTTQRAEALRAMSVELLFALCSRWRMKAQAMAEMSAEIGAMPTIHTYRIMLDDFTDDERKQSARWLLAHGYALPKGFKIENGNVVKG